jgi:hypothetical protein
MVELSIFFAILKLLITPTNRQKIAALKSCDIHDRLQEFDFLWYYQFMQFPYLLGHCNRYLYYAHDL